LTAAAKSAFGDEQRAHLFLHSGHDRTLRQHPYDFCTSKPKFDLILALMPKRR
jgi:hypothetical protein